MEATSCEDAKEFIAEVVAVVPEDVVLISPVALSDLRYQTVEYFVSGQLANVWYTLR